MADTTSPPRFDRWSGNLLHGQLVIRTLRASEYDADPDLADCGNEFGYWLCRFDLTDLTYVPIARFASQEHIELFAAAIEMPVVYWPEGEL